MGEADRRKIRIGMGESVPRILSSIPIFFRAQARARV